MPLKAPLSPSHLTSPQRKGLSMLSVVLQPFVFESGVSLSYFISFASYQPCEVRTAICIVQARAPGGKATCLGSHHTRSWLQGVDFSKLFPPCSRRSRSAQLCGVVSIVKEHGLSLLNLGNHLNDTNCRRENWSWDSNSWADYIFVQRLF